MQDSKLPNYNSKAFVCPNCSAFSNQFWNEIHLVEYGYNDSTELKNSKISICNSCYEISFWKDEKLIYPTINSAPFPNKDMPEDVKIDFEEARKICYDSSRGAAALLRLAMEKLCKYLGKKNNDLNTNIALLVANGLPKKIQMALDSVRVIGNKAVHPGQIDLKDDLNTAFTLFNFINIICENQITQMNLIDKFYNDKLPETAKIAIQKRDKK
ncbi:MAG TPA: DUF4145 domain-containing protein [Leadbetterella sp.]|nr:DUF4145 domain-containing protein [Leadbetterella sp.]